MKTLEEFNAKVKEIYECAESTNGSYEEFTYKRVGRGWNAEMEKVFSPRIYVYWETGGYSGGNCWGDTAEPYETGNEQVPLTLLDFILKEICPTLSFIDYNEIRAKIVKEYDFGNVEYYGNSTNYNGYQVYLVELHKELIERKII